MAELSITKSAAPGAVNIGEPFAYTVTVKNNSSLNAATGVKVTDLLPAGICVTGISYTIGTIDFSQETIAWNLGTFPPLATATLTITAVAHEAGPKTNTATVAADGLLPDIAADATTTVNPAADVAIYKQVCADHTAVGGSLTYLITVVNNGPSPATDVSVTDTFAPDSVVITQVTSSQGGCNPPIGNTATCTLGTLLPQSVATIAVTATPAAAGAVQNTAVVTTSVTDPDLTNNSATVFATVNPAADISVTKTVLPAVGVIGSPVTYTITVTNNGPSPAANVTMTDVFPSGLTIQTASCPVTGQTMTCNIPTLPVGQSQTYTVVATPTTTGLFTNTATVSAATPDPNLCNNSATASLLVGAVTGTNLTITKTHAPATVLVCTPLTYTLRVTNEGPSVATGVMLVDQLPPGAELVSISASQGTCCYPWKGCCSPTHQCCHAPDCQQPASSCQLNREVVCQLGSLAIGASAAVQITVRPTMAGTLVNTALVTANQDDIIPADNQVTDTAEVITFPEQCDHLTAVMRELVTDSVLDAAYSDYVLAKIQRAKHAIARKAEREAQAALADLTQEIDCLLKQAILPQPVGCEILEIIGQINVYSKCMC